MHDSESEFWREGLYAQFGAAIAMFENAVRACPDELWTGVLSRADAERPDLSQFWYIAYHTLFFLDYYLSPERENFMPPAPFTLSEFDESGELPPRVYRRDELLDYLEHCWTSFRATMQALNEETAARRCKLPWLDAGNFELHIYNMRHVQEHAAQLSLFLGQHMAHNPGWVKRSE
jgi:hypothetical protein